MKNVLRLLTVAALATVFALPALAQGTPAAAPGPCTTEADAKAALYKKFLESYRGTPDQQKVAYESGKEYLTKYGTCPDDADKKVTTFVQNWVGKYEKAVLEFNCTKAVNENPAQAFQICRDILASNPDNLKVYLQLVFAGSKNVQKGNKTTNAEALNAARKAMDLIEHGKTSDIWVPFANQQDAPIGLLYYVGLFSYDTAPEDAAKQLLKVAQSTNPLAKEPSTYQLLGASYYNGELKKLAAEYKEKYEGKEETPESKALFDHINIVLDRVIDAYARAVALSNGNPQFQNAVKPVLTGLYKQRHENSDAGLNELIASVLSKPIPIPGQEPVAPVAPSSSSSGMTGTDGAGTTAKPSATTQPATTMTTQPAATNTAKPAAATPATNGTKPAATPTPTPGAKPAAPAQKRPVSKATPAAKGRAAKTTAGH